MVEAAYSVAGDGLPIKQSEELRITAGKLLQGCPLVNLPTFIKLNEALDQLQLLQTVFQCLNMLQRVETGEKVISERTIGRALLIVAYGVSALP